MNRKIKIGGGCFLTSYILSFETKEAFINFNLRRVHHSKDPVAYLEAVWELANRSNDFKKADVNNDIEVVDTVATDIVDAPVVEKPARKRKKSAKKE